MLKASLAGYNIDSSLIRKLNTETATPEVISAAYARISRSPKSVTELREEALLELTKARRSNQNIIFELGHSSVAEHAVFNFDIIGISRLLTETLETIRLASFTEKSQRYVTFQDFVIPAELATEANAKLKDEYTSLMTKLFDEYQASIAALGELYFRQNPSLSALERDCMAKEDARYILPLATKTQLGMTINARSLENLLKRLAQNPLQEAAELFNQLHDPVQEICPSLVRYTAKDSFQGTFEPSDFPKIIDTFTEEESVRVINLTADPENLILSALLFERTQGDFAICQKQVAALDSAAKQILWEQIFAKLQPWHKMHRAFELVDLTFEARMSESCWAQFKRHRIGTMLKQHNPSSYPITFPKGIMSSGRFDQWNGLWDELSALRQKLSQLNTDLSPYARINADKVKVLVKMNLREVYHFVRLRSDAHAQWEIRELSHALVEQLRVSCPQAAAFLCGKSELLP